MYDRIGAALSSGGPVCPRLRPGPPGHRRPPILIAETNHVILEHAFEAATGWVGRVGPTNALPSRPPTEGAERADRLRRVEVLGVVPVRARAADPTPRRGRDRRTAIAGLRQGSEPVHGL